MIINFYLYITYKNNKEILYKIYKNLFDNNIITQLDLDICKEWLTYF